MKDITANTYGSAARAWYKAYELWAVLFLYLLALCLSVSRHELWGDELHSWNIARSSSGIGNLVANSRYEGHPPLWYIVLFVLSRFTHNPLSVQYLHVCICCLTAFVFLFHCRLLLSYKCMALFGYYFLYEYGTLSRNYMLGILLAFILCMLIARGLKGKMTLYYCLLFLLSNTHFLSLILAVAFHAHYAWPLFKNKTNKGAWLMPVLMGFIVLLPALYFIFPPANSGLNVGFWLHLWDKKHLAMAVQAPLKALAPVPAWWEYHAWNTQALLQLQSSYLFLKYITPLISAGLLALGAFVLWPQRQALRFYCINIMLTLCFALVFPLNSARYVGFIFIGFIIALWLSNSAAPLGRARRMVLCAMLLCQLAGAFVAVKKDWQFPFTRADDIKTISALVPAGDDLITDYWCLDYATAFLNRPVYCVGFNREKSFLLWDREMIALSEKHDMYTEGTRQYFEKSGRTAVYFLANTPWQDIVARDSLFFKTFDARLLTGRYNAMEKYSNIYLYKISPGSKK